MNTQIYPHSANWDKVDPNKIVRGTKETEPRPYSGHWKWQKPNTEQRHKTFTIEQIRVTHAIRDRKAKEGLLCPPLPCPYKICAACDSYRAYWMKALQEELPRTLTLSL